jgi:hypothetical protein
MINNSQVTGLNLYPPTNDASFLQKIHEGEIYTTPAELATYLSQVPGQNNTSPVLTIPDPPLSLCVIPSDSSLTIFFVPGSNGGTPITNYKYSTDGINYTLLSPAQTSSPLTIDDLTNGVEYSIYLQAVNSVGVSLASTAVSAAPIPNSFDPTDITGLNVWLDGQNITNVVITSGQVSAWNDSSSSANNFTANGGIITYDQPSSINNRPALNFTTATPTSTYLSNNFNISPGSNELTLFMVVNQTGTGTGNSELFFTYDNFRYFDLFNNTNSTDILSLNARNDTQRSSGVNIITSPPIIVIISVVLSTTSGTMYVNGTLTDINSTSFTGTTFASFDATLNWAISGGGFKGCIGEVLTYPSVLVDLDRQKIEGYLAWKWGLQSQLSSENPWQTSPPTTGGTAPGAPTLTYILPGNNIAYTYFTAGTGTAINYQYTTNSGTNYTNSSPASLYAPAVVSGLTNGTSSTIQLRAYNTSGYSSISNSLSITPSNASLPAEWLLFDPNEPSCYSGSGSVVNNIGSYGALAGTITGSVPYITGTNITTKVFNFIGINPSPLPSGGFINFGAFNFGTNFTITAWVYASSSYSINGLLTNGTANVDTAGFKFGWNSWNTSNYNLIFETGDGTTGNWSVPSSLNNTISVATWQHISVIFNRSSNVSVFLLNGLPVNVYGITTATNVTVSASNFNIGAYIGDSYRMKAQLGLLKVFNSSLSAAQVYTDFSNTRARFGI